MPLLKNVKILIDLSHKEMLNIEDREFSEFYQLLKRISSEIEVNNHSKISNRILNGVDILIIGNPINDYFSTAELEAITNYIRMGGSLLLISEYGGDFLQKTNLNDLSRGFGIIFSKNIVKEKNKQNHNCHSILSITNIHQHPITYHVRNIIIGGACSLKLTKTGIPILYSNNNTWTETFKTSPDQYFTDKEGMQQIIAASTKFGRGKVVAIGDIDLFTVDPNIGINQMDNRKFILNIFDWLLTPNDEEDAMVWALNNIGLMQNQIKEMNQKINNIIETVSILAERVQDLEENTYHEISKKELSEKIDEDAIKRETSLI